MCVKTFLFPFSVQARVCKKNATKTGEGPLFQPDMAESLITASLEGSVKVTGIPGLRGTGRSIN